MRDLRAIMSSYNSPELNTGLYKAGYFWKNMNTVWVFHEIKTH